jgi:YggT family protein
MGLFFGEPVADATTLSQTVYLVFTFLMIAIVIRALMSWFQLDPRSPLIQALNSVTEPVLEPFRRIIPRVMGLDFSPMVAIIVLGIVSRVLQQFFIDQGI